ncbi:unnamed protein product [Ascophyllum nodosum]
MEEVKEAFGLFDTEGKGVIDIRELKAAFRALGFQVSERYMLFVRRDSHHLPFMDSHRLVSAHSMDTWIHGLIVKKQEIREMLVDVDKEGAASVSFNDFIQMVTPKILARDPKEEIMKIFALFDEDGTGGISFRNLKRIATELGENLSDDELQEMIEEADRDHDGVVNAEEFYRVMRKREDPLDDLDSDDEY